MLKFPVSWAQLEHLSSKKLVPKWRKTPPCSVLRKTQKSKKIMKINRDLDKHHGASMILLEIAAKIRDLDNIFECNTLECLLSQVDSPAQSTESPPRSNSPLSPSPPASPPRANLPHSPSPLPNPTTPANLPYPSTSSTSFPAPSIPAIPMPVIVWDRCALEEPPSYTPATDPPNIRPFYWPSPPPPTSCGPVESVRIFCSEHYRPEPQCCLCT